VLLQLKVKYQFLEISVHELALVAKLQDLTNFFAGELLAVELLRLENLLDLLLIQTFDLLLEARVGVSEGQRRVNAAQLGISPLDLLKEPLLEHVRVLGIVHLLDDLPPHPLIDTASLDYFEHAINFDFDFEGVLVLDEDFQQVQKGVLDVHLDESELFVALVLQNPGEQRDVVVVGAVFLDPVHDGHCPLDNEVLKAILLIEVGVHVLLHCFPRLVRVFTLLIKFDLLAIHVMDRISKLLQR